MTHKSSLNIAVIGAGISGIAAANVLQKQGHRVTIYEKSSKIGGVWAVAYPQVTLQNSYDQYHLADFPWPFQPDLHPTGAQIMHYMQEAVEKLNLNVCLEHEIVSLKEQDGRWLATIKNTDTTEDLFFDYVVIAVGQYTEGKYRPQFPGEDQFQGQILTERDIKDMSVFAGKKVVVVGFGKSAVDMATMAVEKGAQVHQVFRTPRWLIPRYIFGIHMKYALFGRHGSIMMPSWVHPSKMERFLHSNLKFMIKGFWTMISNIVRLQHSAAIRGKDEAARRRYELVQPKHDLLPDLRSAAAVAPDNYYPFVVSGKIEPHQAQITGFTQDGVQLSTGETIQNDLTILSMGSKSPTFPFLPEKYRTLLEGEEDGAQLYRHLIHPRIPNLGFAGFNHGFMHIPAVEVGTLWLSALLDGSLTLPSVEEMEASIETIRQWKRENIHFEPSRSCAISTRYQQYIDALLMELGLSPYRKTPNVLAEIFAPYSAQDYRDIIVEYQKRYQNQPQPAALKTLPYHA